MEMSLLISVSVLGIESVVLIILVYHILKLQSFERVLIDHLEKLENHVSVLESHIDKVEKHGNEMNKHSRVMDKHLEKVVKESNINNLPEEEYEDFTNEFEKLLEKY